MIALFAVLSALAADDCDGVTVICGTDLRPAVVVISEYASLRPVSDAQLDVTFLPRIQAAVEAAPFAEPSARVETP